MRARALVSSVLAGISNMFATIPGIVGPLVADGMAVRLVFSIFHS